MKAYNHDIGLFSENLAQNYLRENGYYIIEENFNCKVGEIDIIALNGPYLCFIEVKSRHSNKYGSPMESVTIHKQRKIRRVAEYYILTHRPHCLKFRFDVVEVFLNNDDYDINLIKNAF